MWSTSLFLLSWTPLLYPVSCSSVVGRKVSYGKWKLILFTLLFDPSWGKVNYNSETLCRSWGEFEEAVSQTESKNSQTWFWIDFVWPWSHMKSDMSWAWRVFLHYWAPPALAMHENWIFMKSFGDCFFSNWTKAFSLWRQWCSLFSHQNPRGLSNSVAGCKSFYNPETSNPNISTIVSTSTQGHKRTLSPQVLLCGSRWYFLRVGPMMKK